MRRYKKLLAINQLSLFKDYMVLGESKSNYIISHLLLELEFLKE